MAVAEAQVALVTGGGRGVGRNVAVGLAEAGLRVAVSARTREQVEETAHEIHGLAVEADVSRADDVEAMVATVERELGPIDLLVANAGVSLPEREAWTVETDDWWHVFEVNVLGHYLSAKAVIPGMLERGRGRIVMTGSGAAYLPGSSNSAYAASKAAVHRLAEVLAQQLRGRIPVFAFSPGLVRTAMTEGAFPDDAPWTPPECAPRLVVAIAEGKLDRLAGRYLHAEHDVPDEVAARADEILAEDLNAIRLKR